MLNGQVFCRLLTVQQNELWRKLKSRDRQCFLVFKRHQHRSDEACKAIHHSENVSVTVATRDV